MLRKNLYKDLDKYRKTRNSQKQKYYNKTKYARNRYYKWTKEEDRLVIEHSITDRELSQKIQRSMNAILVRRNRLKNKVVKENKIMVVQKYKRGQIWWIRDNSPEPKEHLQSGTRPVIIVSNDAVNRFSNNLTIIPCTTAEKKDLPTHVKLQINGDSLALCEMITTISNTTIMSYIGTCDKELMDRIDEAILIALGITNKDKVIKFDTDTIKNKICDTASIINTSSISDDNVVAKPGRKAATLADKQRFVNDYENHDADYMLKKYKIKDKKCLAQKVYLYRKAIKEDS